MQQEVASLIVYGGDLGLFSAVVGFAVMLLLPERAGHRFGGTLAMLGGLAMGCEVALTHVM